MTTGRVFRMGRVAVSAVAMLLAMSPLLADELPGYPLRNGDFSVYQGYSRPAGWALGREAGQIRLNVDPVPRFPIQGTAVAVVRCATSAQGYIFQDVDLLEGRWRFQAEVTGTPGARARLEISGAKSLQTPVVTVTGNWQRLEMKIPQVSGRLRVHLRFQTSGEGEVRFRRARLDAV
ncbi:MAG TPA: hypothetical protein DCE39_00110, partial [Planctomycetaceae bacterium]|nr:hypothetical protein [Planctomycetaceae bacterium]